MLVPVRTHVEGVAHAPLVPLDLEFPYGTGVLFPLETVGHQSQPPPPPPEEPLSEQDEDEEPLS